MSKNAVNMMLQQNKPVKKRKKRVAVKKTGVTTAKKSTKSVKATKQKPIELSYRARTIEDDAFIMELTRNQLGSIHEQAFGQPFPEQQFLSYIQSGAPTVVVEQKGQPIGYYSYLLGPDGKMHVSAMVIDPKYQSSGIGKTVMARLEQEAIRHGVRTLEVFVQENNAQSLAFTRSLGFQEVFRIEPNTIGFQKQLVAVAQG